MRSTFVLALVLALPFALAACGDDKPAENELPIGDVGNGDPVTPDDLADMQKKWAEAARNNPGFGMDPEQAKKMMKDMGLPTTEGEAKEYMKSMGGSVTEAELDTWWSVQKKIMEATKADNKAEVARLAMAHGMKHAILSGKVGKALGMYKVRKEQNALTDEDKKMASVYEKYIKLVDAMSDD